MICKVLSVILLLSLLSGCPATLYVDLRNDKGSPISVLYSTGYESKIGVGEIKEEIYKYECIHIQSNDIVYDFKPIVLDESYIDIGTFSSSVRASFTENDSLRIYMKSDPDQFIELERGC